MTSPVDRMMIGTSSVASMAIVTSPIDRMMIGTLSVARMTTIMTSLTDRMMIGRLSVLRMTIMTSPIFGDCEDDNSDPICCMIMIITSRDLYVG